MKRVVITGMGITSCLGNTLVDVTNSLKNVRSGIRFNPVYKDYNFRSQVSGHVDVNLEDHIDRKYLRFMGKAAGYAYLSMQDAIKDSGLSHDLISHPRTGLIAASGGASSANIVESADIIRTKGVKRIGPYRVTRTMGSTVSACISTSFGIKGINYSITSACATSAHCIGNAVEQIQLGKQDIIFAGGGEEESWCQTGLFDAMGALSSNYNDQAEIASRAYDKNRDGFVIASGAGILVLEELEHALARNAKIYGEIVGYAATSDGSDMVAPSGEGAQRCMEIVLKNLKGEVDYINTHGTSTPIGDNVELKAIKRAFSNYKPLISSTKSLSGHSLGAAGVQEAIYCLLMMKNGFITPSAHIQELDDEAKDLNIILDRCKEQEINTILSNSFGFGGTNACLVFQKYQN